VLSLTSAGLLGNQKAKITTLKSPIISGEGAAGSNWLISLELVCAYV